MIRRCGCTDDSFLPIVSRGITRITVGAPVNLTSTNGLPSGEHPRASVSGPWVTDTRRWFAVVIKRQPRRRVTVLLAGTMFETFGRP